MQDRHTKDDHFHLKGIGAPQLLREFINLYRWYVLNFKGFKFKMPLPSLSSPSRNYTSHFSGVVLLSLFVAGLQNSCLNRVEFTCSTIPSCVHLPGGVSFLSVYLRIYRCPAGTSPDCCSFVHFTVFGSFHTTGYLFRDLMLLGSVFPHIITIICINKKINGVSITMKKLSHSLTFRKML